MPACASPQRPCRRQLQHLRVLLGLPQPRPLLWGHRLPVVAVVVAAALRQLLLRSLGSAGAQLEAQGAAFAGHLGTTQGLALRHWQ